MNGDREDDFQELARPKRWVTIPPEVRMDTPRVERVLKVFSSFEELEADERAYWWSRTPQERLQAMELMRQLNHGSGYSSQRLQRVLTVAER